MTRGYAGKLLDVDLNHNKIQDLVLDDAVLKSYVGGRGLATHILWDRSVAGSPQAFPLLGYPPGQKISLLRHGRK